MQVTIRLEVAMMNHLTAVEALETAEDSNVSHGAKFEVNHEYSLQSYEQNENPWDCVTLNKETKFHQRNFYITLEND